MLIQAHCQQEREKRCTITAKTTSEANTNVQNESNVEKMNTNELTEHEDDGRKTPKIEPNASPKSNDVEMIDASETVPVIKQEPEDDVTSFESDPLAETSNDDSVSKMNEKNDLQSERQIVKTEFNENGNIDGNELSKENNDSDSTDEIIKIEESTNNNNNINKDDPYSKDINIDPRTYCKLGHFHLLLEDYAKGNF